MKKLLLSVAVGSVLGLTGCLADGEDAPVSQEQAGVPYVRVAFDPAAGDVSVPNNLLFNGTVDGTLNLPLPAQGATDPFESLSSLDGWSTSFPITFNFNYPSGEYGTRSVTINAATAESAGAVRVFRVLPGGSEACPNAPSLVVACGPVGGDNSELVYGEEFVTSFNPVSGALSVVPLKPLDPKASYLFALTDVIEDDRGRSVRPSQTYFAASSSDIELEGDGALVQGIVQQNHSVLELVGVDRESIIYSSMVTTQSINDVLLTTSGLIARDTIEAQGGTFSVSPVTVDTPSGNSLIERLGENAPAAGSIEYLVASTAVVYDASFGAPYFSGVGEGAALTENWDALFISPAAIALALQAEAEDAPKTTVQELEQLVTASEAATGRDFSELDVETAVEEGNFAAFAGIIPYAVAQGLGSDLATVKPNLTANNPIPAPKLTADVNNIPLYVSVPSLNQVNMARAMLTDLGVADLAPLSAPAAGWPVVIFQHGITRSKEDFMAIAGTLAVAGYAVVAIDHPLHGERGFGNTNATVGEQGAINYLNLQSLQTARDNVRQSTIDLVSLRLAMLDTNFAVSAQVNPYDVSFLGYSLGGISGTNFVALMETLAQENSDVELNQSVIAMAAGGIAQFLLESEQFGPLILAAVSGNGTIQGAELAARAQQFAFAAQTVIDSGDPINYGGGVEGPLLLIQANGDQVIPNDAGPLAGTEALARIIGLSEVAELTVAEASQSGFVKLEDASHGSLLQQGEDDAENMTLSIQLMIATWLETQGTVIAPPSEGTDEE